jgi:hypothetical protein
VTRLAPLIALVAGALSAAPASAKTVEATDVISPTGLISCLAVKHGSGIECTAPYLPDIGDLDSYLALKRHGRASLSERGDNPGYGHKPVKLHYGDTWHRPGIRCAMRTSGLRCRNLDGHGFSIAKGAVRRF